ncbi:hypothetical protein CRYUN_Cryun03dG0085900 [Craigia yunnanensis]
MGKGNSSSMLTHFAIPKILPVGSKRRRFISGEEFLSVPEFAVNPLSQFFLFSICSFPVFRIWIEFQGAFLSAHSPRATLQHKIEFIFKMYDSDGNGKVTFNDMLDVLHDLNGQFISEQQGEQVLTQVLEEAGYTKESLLVVSDL